MNYQSNPPFAGLRRWSTDCNYEWQEELAMTTVGLAVIDYHRSLEVHVLTDLTIRNATAIRNGIMSAWEACGRPARLILDLAGARHIDSSGVGALLDVSHRTEDAGIALVIQGLHKAPRRMLQRTGLGMLFHIAGEGAVHPA
jgi:anti-anti-sigma factor